MHDFFTKRQSQNRLVHQTFFFFFDKKTFHPETRIKTVGKNTPVQRKYSARQGKHSAKEISGLVDVLMIPQSGDLQSLAILRSADIAFYKNAIAIKNSRK